MTSDDARRAADVDADEGSENVGRSRLELYLGFTLGLGMEFQPAVRWAAEEGFEFVELLLDGPYARERIADRTEGMRAALDDAGVGWSGTGTLEVGIEDRDTIALGWRHVEELLGD